jgi:RNA polymerase sigma-70 factor (ECF subfamily)
MTNPNDFGSEANVAARLKTRSPHGRGAVLKLVVQGAAEGGGAPDETGTGVDANGTTESPSIGALLAAARPRMYAVALRLTKNHDDAEDVVQEAMLKAWRNMGRFEGRAAFTTWIHRIVVNAALDRLRSRRPEVSTRAGAGGRDDGEVAQDPPLARSLSPSSPETPEDLVESAEIGAAVHRAMGALSPVHREALALRELDGESYQSIARIVHCPIGTVMSRLHHARHRLAEVITTNHRELVPQAA